MHLIALTNPDTTREALRNADALIREGLLLPLQLPIAVTEAVRAEVPSMAKANIVHLDARGDFDQILGAVRPFFHSSQLKRALVGAVNDTAALCALRAFDEAGRAHQCGVFRQYGTRETQNELRRPGTRLIGSVAHFQRATGMS